MKAVAFVTPPAHIVVTKDSQQYRRFLQGVEKRYRLRMFISLSNRVQAYRLKVPNKAGYHEYSLVQNDFDINVILANFKRKSAFNVF